MKKIILLLTVLLIIEQSSIHLCAMEELEKSDNTENKSNRHSRILDKSININEIKLDNSNINGPINLDGNDESSRNERNYYYVEWIAGKISYLSDGTLIPDYNPALGYLKGGKQWDLENGFSNIPKDITYYFDNNKGFTLSQEEEFSVKEGLMDVHGPCTITAPYMKIENFYILANDDVTFISSVKESPISKITITAANSGEPIYIDGEFTFNENAQFCFEGINISNVELSFMN
jgi:hypothetical protein